MLRRPPRATLSLHDALPISRVGSLPLIVFLYLQVTEAHTLICNGELQAGGIQIRWQVFDDQGAGDRKSTRLNSSHVRISYAVFCLKKKNHHRPPPPAPVRPC